jgi:hypothetical protein
MQRPLLWFPSQARGPDRPQPDQTHGAWDPLVHRGRSHALRRCHRPPAPRRHPQRSPPRSQGSAPDPAPPPGRISRAVDLPHHPQWDPAGPWRQANRNAELPGQTRPMRRTAALAPRQLRGNEAAQSRLSRHPQTEASVPAGQPTEARELRQALQRLPQGEPHDPHDRRLRDARYADGTPVQA